MYSIIKFFLLQEPFNKLLLYTPESLLAGYTYPILCEHAPDTVRKELANLQENRFSMFKWKGSERFVSSHLRPNGIILR